MMNLQDIGLDHTPRGPRRIARLLIAVVVLAACGGGAAVESSAPPEGDSPSTVSTDAPTATSTTVAETTTTEPTDPIDLLMTAAEERSIAVERDLLQTTAEGLCSLAEDLPEGSRLEQRLQVSSVTPLSNFAGFHEITTTQALELYALMVETSCPEHASLLEFRSDQYASAIGADYSVGDCYLTSLVLAARIPTDCSEPHNGEIVGIAEVPDGQEFPSPGGASIFEILNVTDCATPSNEYIGGFGQSNGFQLIAQSKEEFDGGERGVWCTYSVGRPILVGSVAGQAERLQAVNGAAEATVTLCEHDGFAATVSNSSNLDIAVYVSFSQYFPTGSAFGFDVEVPAGGTVDFERTFSDPDTSTPLDCRPFVTAVPLPVDG